MADRSSIEWTDATWNPIRARNKATGKLGWHCEHASEGCRNCYAEAFNRDRLGTRLPYKPGHLADVEIFLDEQILLQPLRWRRPRTDLRLLDDGPVRTLRHGRDARSHLRRHGALPAAHFPGADEAVGADAAWFEQQRPHLRLSRHCDPLRRSSGVARPGRSTRPGRSASASAVWPLPNVWLGVSCEDQRRPTRACPTCSRRRRPCASCRPSRCSGRSTSSRGGWHAPDRMRALRARRATAVARCAGARWRACPHDGRQPPISTGSSSAARAARAPAPCIRLGPGRSATQCAAASALPSTSSNGEIGFPVGMKPIVRHDRSRAACAVPVHRREARFRRAQP